VLLHSADDVGPRYLHIFVSPHFDDVALSVGGAALRAAGLGEPVLVVAICTAAPTGGLTGFAAGQHESWGGGEDPWQTRAAEERAAMVALGADYLWLDYPDAIYRGDQYLSDDDLFGPVKPGDGPLAARLADDLLAVWRHCPAATVYLPLALGNHVDHQICRAAAPSLVAAGAPVLFYEDIPYALRESFEPDAARMPVDVASDSVVVEFGDAIAEKVALVERYASQVPWIFREIGSADVALRAHAARTSRRPGGSAERLWRPRIDATRISGARGASPRTNSDSEMRSANGGTR
jgi:LmbE family N-acetylglucosaminyl deacetylase